LNIALGICGSIAAYKSLELIRFLKKAGADVRVILTKSAVNFVTSLSCQTLSTNDVYIDQFVLSKGIKHLALSEWADMLVIAPATANIIGKAVSGIGDDLLSTAILSFQKPVLFVPAMDSGMWQNKVVESNVKRLIHLGHHFVEPTTGILASGKIGKGRFPSVAIIYKKILTILGEYRSLAGKRFLITGGRTEEDLDSVRVITNRSSGRMAMELCDAVVCRDGEVKGIFGEVSIPIPGEMDISRVRTSDEMLRELKKHLSWCDCLIMAAAVGDYKPCSKSLAKIHSQKIKLDFEKSRDLLKAIAADKGKMVVVGFSLEIKDQLKRARQKLVSKGLNFIVANAVSALASDKTEAMILKKAGKTIDVRSVSKWQLAHKILDECMIEMQKRRIIKKRR